MSEFIQGEDRSQATLFPERLDDYVAEDSSVRVIDVFLDDLDLSGLGFKTEPSDTGRPAYLPSINHAQAVCIRLSQPGALESATGGGGSKYRPLP